MKIIPARILRLQLRRISRSHQNGASVQKLTFSGGSVEGDGALSLTCGTVSECPSSSIVVSSISVVSVPFEEGAIGEISGMLLVGLLYLGDGGSRGCRCPVESLTAESEEFSRLPG